VDEELAGGRVVYVSPQLPASNLSGASDRSALRLTPIVVSGTQEVRSRPRRTASFLQVRASRLVEAAAGGSTEAVRDEPQLRERPQSERSFMTDVTSEAIQQNTDLDTLGPVDYLVVEFPAGASNFTGEMAKELLALVDAGTIRVIDVLILTKNEDGSVDAMELSDIEELGALQAIEAELAELLAADDVEDLAAAMEPGSTAGVLIWENLWAAPFASAARRSGGQLIANGRIPIQAIIASIEADEATPTEGD
jgi:hypothetical protein